MNPISNNPFYIEGIRYTTGVDNSQKELNSFNQNNVTYDNYLPQDIKNIIVSEKPDKYSKAANFYRYQYSSPASRLINTGQTFNEIEKPFSYNLLSTLENPGTANNPSQLNYNNHNAVSGYYIFDNFKQNNLNKEPGSEPSNPMKKKLEKTYRSGKESEPGTLVNMTYY